MKNKSGVVKGLCDGIEGLFKKNKVTYVKGFGKITSANEVVVELSDGGQQTLQADKIVIATGSEVTPLPGIEVSTSLFPILFVFFGFMYHYLLWCRLMKNALCRQLAPCL